MVTDQQRPDTLSTCGALERDGLRKTGGCLHILTDTSNSGPLVHPKSFLITCHFGSPCCPRDYL